MSGSLATFLLLASAPVASADGMTRLGRAQLRLSRAILDALASPGTSGTANASRPKRPRLFSGLTGRRTALPPPPPAPPPPRSLLRRAFEQQLGRLRSIRWCLLPFDQTPLLQLLQPLATLLSFRPPCGAVVALLLHRRVRRRKSTLADPARLLRRSGSAPTAIDPSDRDYCVYGSVLSEAAAEAAAACEETAANAAAAASDDDASPAAATDTDATAAAAAAAHARSLSDALSLTASAENRATYVAAAAEALTRAAELRGRREEPRGAERRGAERRGAERGREEPRGAERSRESPPPASATPPPSPPRAAYSDAAAERRRVGLFSCFSPPPPPSRAEPAALPLAAALVQLRAVDVLLRALRAELLEAEAAMRLAERRWAAAATRTLSLTPLAERRRSCHSLARRMPMAVTRP